MYSTQFLSMRNGVFVGAVIASLLLYTLPLSAATTSTLLPVSDGTFTSFTPSAGTSHFTLVDEAACNGITDYNSTVTVGNRDSYGVSLASIPNGATITNIQITPCASRNSGGGANPIMNVFYRFGAFNSADAGAYSLTGTTPVVLAATNFSSLALVKGASSTLEVGAVYTSGTKGVRLSQMATVITYTPPPKPTVTTDVATLVSTSTATLNGSANPNGLSAIGWFRYATTSISTCTDAFGARTPALGGTALGGGTSSVAYAQAISGLNSASTYYYCALASSTAGVATGTVTSFTTL